MNKETKIYILIIVILCIILAIFIPMTINKINSRNTNNFGKNMQRVDGMNNSDVSSVETKGATEVTDEKTLTGTLETTDQDTSVVKVSDGGNLTLENATINKSGDSTNTENSEFYGVNAALLTTKNSTTTIKNTNINTNAKGANAVFATGSNAKVYISDSTITSNGSSSARGLDSTYGGYIEANNVTISTKGGSSATLATDRGEGTVIARNSKLSTAGAGSPIIYSTGDITLEKSEGTATASQICVIEGKNQATITDSTLTCSSNGNRNNVDNCAVMIYQSMSGDASEGTGVFNAKNSNLKVDKNSSLYTSSPFFFM